MVKPVDSAGSKGVSRADIPEHLNACVQEAQKFSNNNEFIVESYLKSKLHSSDSECFSVDGSLKFVSFSAQRFDSFCKNPYVPAAFSWSPSISKKHQEELTSELQRLLNLLNMKTSLYNVETREYVDGKAYIMKCSPRGRGNRLAEMIRYSTGTDLISNAIRASLGESVIDVEQRSSVGCWAEIILHSDKSSMFKDVYIAETIQNNVIEEDIWIKKGEIVERFSGANKTIGTLVLKFEAEAKMNEVLDHQSQYIKVNVVNA